MPISDEQLERLAAEAMVKEGVAAKQRAQTPVDMRQAGDRLRVASQMVGSSLEALDKSMHAAKSALNMFMAEWAAAVSAGVSPETLSARSQDAVREMEARIRPKTFNGESK